MDKEIESKIAGALFDFLGYLATGDELLLGGSHVCTPVVERLKEWAKKRNLNLDKVDMFNWNKK